MEQTLKVSVYVPDELSRSDEVIEHVADRFTDLYGGVTIIPNTEGRWKNEAGEVMYDTITIVECISSEIVQDEIIELAMYVRDTLEQDAVMFEVEETSIWLV